MGLWNGNMEHIQALLLLKSKDNISLKTILEILVLHRTQVTNLFY